MDSQADFDVNEAIKNYDSDPSEIATPDASRELQDFEHEPERLGEEFALLNAELNPIVDAIADSPEAITRSAHFDTLQFLLKFSAHIPAATLGKILDLVGSALATQADVVNADIQAQDQDALKLHKTLLEMYGFLLRWTISAVESREAQEKPTASVPAARGRAKGAKSKAVKDSVWDASAQLEAALDRISKVLRLELSRIFVTTSERDTFIGLLTKPVYHILENSEKTARIKNAAIRNHSFRVLAMAVRNHGHAYSKFLSCAHVDADALTCEQMLKYLSLKRCSFTVICRRQWLNYYISSHESTTIRSSPKRSFVKSVTKSSAVQTGKVRHPSLPSSYGLQSCFQKLL
jgi:condensin complex subunit 1